MPFINGYYYFYDDDPTMVETTVELSDPETPEWVTATVQYLPKGEFDGWARATVDIDAPNEDDENVWRAAIERALDQAVHDATAEAREFRARYHADEASFCEEDFASGNLDFESWTLDSDGSRVLVNAELAVRFRARRAADGAVTVVAEELDYDAVYAHEHPGYALARRFPAVPIPEPADDLEVRRAENRAWASAVEITPEVTRLTEDDAKAWAVTLTTDAAGGSSDTWRRSIDACRTHLFNRLGLA